MSNSEDAMDPMQLFQEDLRNEDYEQNIHTISKLATIAVALGPARTRTDLLTFLLEFSEQDNDEAQTLVARQLGDFADLVGGPSHVGTLLPLLEKLCGEEEFVVRDAAVESLAKLAGKMSKPDLPTKYIPLLKRLANGDWFTTRVSACGIFAAVYPHVPEQIQAELRGLYNSLCNDDTPMVRKSAFLHLGKFAVVLQKPFFKSDIVPILKALSIDDMDSMRIYTIDACAQLAKTLDQAEYHQIILPLLEALQGKRLLPIFAKLLRDKESEVRESSCTVMTEVVNTVKIGALEYIAPVLDQLAVDQAPNVRVSFSKGLISLCPAFGKETSAKLLVPLVQQLTKDEHYEVRNNILTRLDVLTDAIGVPTMTAAVLPAVLELAKDPKWRVRMAVVEQTSLLANQLGVKTFEKKIQPVVIQSLSDHVFAIRERACEQIGLIVKEFGGKWAAEKFLPAAFAIYDKTTNYLHRMTCLLVILNSAAAAGGEVVEKSLLPLVCTACVDDVPNVRIAAAKTMIELIPKLDKKIAESKCKPLLQKMAVFRNTAPHSLDLHCMIDVLNFGVLKSLSERR